MTDQPQDQDPDKDVVDILSEDHREVEEMFSELETLSVSDPAVQDRRRLLVDQVTIALVRHAVAEEVVVYPAVKEQISEEEAERAKQEHAEAEESMKALERLDPEDPSFDQEIRNLMAEIRAHVAEEEGEMFPRMRQVMSREQLVKLGGQVEAIKAMAPTRPHPSVPNDPGPRLAAGPVAGLFDRLRDLASGRGKEG